MFMSTRALMLLSVLMCFVLCCYVTRGSGVVSPVSPALRDPGEDAGVTSLCLGLLTQIYNVNAQA